MIWCAKWLNQIHRIATLQSGRGFDLAITYSQLGPLSWVSISCLLCGSLRRYWADLDELEGHAVLLPGLFRLGRCSSQPYQHRRTHNVVVHELSRPIPMYLAIVSSRAVILTDTI